MFSYFIFNGVHSRDMGIYLAAAAPIMRGKERVTNATVLGRAGTLTLPEGEDVYEPYTQQIVVRAKDPQAVTAWLRGDGYITFSTDPDRRQKCRVVNQLQYKKISKHLEWYESQVQIYCQPLKELIHEPEYAYVSGGTLTNLGDTVERPVLTLTGAYGDLAVSGGGKTLTITGLDQELGGCVIDSGANALLSYDKTQLITNLTAGEFPVLPVGASSIQITGAHAGTATIWRRQRWV